MRLIRDDRGFTLIEMGIASMLSAVILVLAITLLLITYRTGLFTQSQGYTLNDGRNALQKIEKEIRGADAIVFCAPVGSCLEVDAQKASGGFENVRYTHTGTDLNREVYDSGSASWVDTGVTIERVANTGADPVFSCEENSTLLRVTVDLRIEPSPQSNPTLNLHTSIRPRNFSSAANCP